MAHFLEPPLHDLAERFRFLDQEIAVMQLPPEAESYLQRNNSLVAISKVRTC
jgi:hypothetical protein